MRRPSPTRISRPAASPSAGSALVQAKRLAAALDNPDDWGDDIAAGFRQLAQVMRATLGELSLAFARGTGVVRVRVWLFGRTTEGTLVGLRSIGTET